MTDAFSPRTGRSPLTGRTVTFLALAAIIVPVVAVVCWLVGSLTAGPDGAVGAFAPEICRRGTCVGDSDVVLNSSVSALASTIPYPVGIAIVGFVIALLTRRRGFLTIPTIIGYVLVLIVSVNAAAYQISGGNLVLGVIIILVAVIGVPVAVVALARQALPAVQPAAVAAPAPARG